MYSFCGCLSFLLWLQLVTVDLWLLLLMISSSALFMRICWNQVVMVVLLVRRGGNQGIKGVRVRSRGLRVRRGQRSFKLRGLLGVVWRWRLLWLLVSRDKFGDLRGRDGHWDLLFINWGFFRNLTLCFNWWVLNCNSIEIILDYLWWQHVWR